MDQKICVRTGKRISLPQFSTVYIPIRCDDMLDLDKLQFVPRHRISHLNVSVEIVDPKQPFLRAYNETSRPIKIPKHTKLGKFKPRVPFRFYDLPQELRDLVLDFALADAHPNLGSLTLKCEPGFVKDGEDGSILMMPTNAGKFGSRYIGRSSIAFPFMSKCSLIFTSKKLADDYQTALWRFLLRNENCWVKLRVHNFYFEAAQFFLARCSQQQLSVLRLPGKLVLQLSLHYRSATGNTHSTWARSAERWSQYCTSHKVSPWVIFTRAFFLQLQGQRRIQQALAEACQRITRGPKGDQSVMILDALDDICRLNKWTSNGYWLIAHTRTEEVLEQEEYYFKGVEYDGDGVLVDQLLLEACPPVCVTEE